jgi:hypothetical protein
MNRKMRARSGTAGTVLLALALAAPAEAQTRREPASSLPLAMAASAGSFAGLYVGAMVGVQSGWLGNGEDNLAGAALMAGAGSVVGTVVALKLASGGKVPAGKAFGASLAGFAAGLAVSYALADATSEGMVAPIAFSVSQGTVAALMTRIW